MVGAAAALGAGERDAARLELQRIEGGAVQLRRGDRALLHYLRGWLALLDGDGAAARREAKAALALAVETGMPWLECLARIALAQTLGDEGDRRGREAQLRSAAALAERSRSDLLRFCAGLAAAGAALEAGEEAAALEALRGAFVLGREHGYHHAPWWRSQAMAELCALALRQGVEADYARTLVRARRLVPRVAPLRLPGWPWPFRVRALGRFELLRESAPVEFSGKGPGRPLELLKVLLAHGGQDVRADQIADALWPHVDADYAHKSFTATLHRLRKLLGEDDAVLLRDARLSLNRALVWVDAWALEQACAALEEALRAPAGAAADAVLRALADEALALYRGPFLPDESEQPSYIASREQLRLRLLRCLARIARRWEDAKQPDAAAECYLRLLEADPLFEAPYRNLMLCYQRAGDLVEARASYERLRTLLQARLKAAPSPETQAVYAGLKPSGP
jgi:DNA-binding SARP family transcriptional activator